MKYVLMFVETEEYADDSRRWTRVSGPGRTARWAEWFADHRRTRSPAATSSAGRYSDNGAPGPCSEPFVTDGPFIEGKEVISGYTEIDVEDLDEALRMVSTWPAVR